MKLDFHGKTLADALREVEVLINEVRLKQSSQACEFITGHGIISKELIRLLSEYQIECTPQLANAGILQAIIE